MFFNAFKHRFKLVLDFINNWNPHFTKHNCSVTTMIYMFCNNIKEFPKCRNEKCNKKMFNVNTYKIGFGSYCSRQCKWDAQQELFKGENNPNFNNRWDDV